MEVCGCEEPRLVVLWDVIIFLNNRGGMAEAFLLFPEDRQRLHTTSGRGGVEGLFPSPSPSW